MKTTKAIITISLALLTVSCTREILADQRPAEREFVTFNAAMGTDATKTYLDGVQVKWQASDSVSLWYGKLDSAMVQSDYFVGTIDSDNARKAVLNGFAVESSAYMAVYPLSAAVDCSKKGKLTVALPTEQALTPGSFAPEANVSVAYSATTTLSFLNIGGLMALKVSSTGGHTVSKIRLVGTSAMSGEVEIKQAKVAAGNPAVDAVTDGVNYVSLDCGNGISDFGTSTYYMVSLPGTHSGFALTFVDSKGKAAVLKSSHAFNIDRGSNTLIANVSLADADFKADSKVYINEIDCQNKKIELYNPGSSSVDISGWVLTKDESSWAFPAGITVPAKGYYVVTCKQSDCSAGPMFGISGDNGFDLMLSNGSLVDRVDNLTSITTIADGETYGRRTDGAADWVVFSAGTIYEDGVFDGDNSKGTVKGLSTEPIVLNEINAIDKYIELYNPTDADISLNGWKLKINGTVVWTGGAENTVAARGYFVVYSSKSKITPSGAPVFSGGISAVNNVFVMLKGGSGTIKDTYIRGGKGNGWGKITLPKNKDASFSRVPDGTGDWKYAAPTCGSVNGSKTGTIEQYPAANGALVLNELDGNNKFIELYNTSTDYSISLEDVTIYKDDGTDPIWTGAPGYSIEPESWVLLYSEDVKDSHTDHDSGLFFSSGLSPKKTLKIEMKNAPASGDPVKLDIFTRGEKGDAWGSKISEQSKSFGRTPDGTGSWYLMETSTPGTANSASAGEIPQI